MLALPLLLVACGPSGLVISDAEDADTGDPVGGDTHTDTDPETIPGRPDTGPDLDDDEIYEAFFDPTVIQTVDIVLSDAAIRRLNRGVDEYVAGDATINGQFFANVGVRLKGSSTYMDLDCGDGYCKGAFKLKLNEFVPGQTYGDLERITLNNMASDYTQSKEVIVYELLRRHNQLASRANYARVTLNGEPWGLYTNIESADDEWLKRRFSDPEGNFWGTGSSYGDFYEQWLDDGWEIKSGQGDYTRFRALIAALDGYQGDFFGELSPYVNVDQWLDYWAWCATVGNYDGYPFAVNDVLVYEDPTDEGRLVFAPWGTDETFTEYSWSGRDWDLVSGRLGSACLADSACVTELKAHIATAVDAYDAADVGALARDAWDLSETDVQTDPKRPFTPDYVWYYRDYYDALIPVYGDYVRGRVGL